MLTTLAPATGTADTARPTARAADWAAVALVLVAAAAVLPFLARHGAWLSARPHYESFPLVLVGALILAYRGLRRAPAGGSAAGNAWAAGAGLAAAWAVLAAAEVLDSAWLACVATLALVPALAYAIGGVWLCRRLFPAWAMLWLLVPPPMDFDRLLILKLQALTTAWSSAVLDACGVYHLAAGNVIEIDGRKLLVEQACSGINSLFSVLACTVFLVFLTGRGWGRGGLLVVAAVAWVLAANVARVTGVALLETRGGVSVTTGWRHEAFGLLLFAAAVGLLLSTDQLFTFLTQPGASPAEGRSPAPAPPAADRAAAAAAARAARCGRIAVVAVPAFLLLIGLHWSAPGSPTADRTLPPPVAPDPELLPAKAGTWERREFTTQSREASSFFGENSQVWTYAAPGGAVVASLDYPFPGWHDLTWCYRGTGWQIDSQSVQAPADAPGGYVEVKMSKPGFRHAYLLFCAFDRHGRPFRARPGGAQEPLFRHEATLSRWRERLAGRPAPEGDPAGAAYQFQVFAEGSVPLSAGAEEEVRRLFLAAQARVKGEWAGGR